MTHLILRLLALGLTCFLPALLHAQTPSAIGGKGLDLDGDGMSDLWEAFHSVGQSGPQFDSDKDGRSDLDENLSGTNPNDPNEYFFLQSFTAEPTLTQYTLRWPSVSDKNYAVEYSTGLEQWTSVGEDIPGTGAVIRSRVTLKTPGTSGFFRIKVKDSDADNDGLLAFERKF